MNRREFLKKTATAFIFTGGLWVPETGILCPANALVGPMMLGGGAAAAPGGAAIQMVQSKDAYAASAAFTSGVSSGNCIIVVGMGNASITDCAKSAGTATIGDVQAITEFNYANGQYHHWYYCFVTGAGTLTMGVTGGGDVGITIHEVSGINSSDAFESSATANNQVAVNAGLSTTIGNSIVFNSLLDETAGCGTVTVGTTGGTWNMTGNQSGHLHNTEYLILTSPVTNLLADFHITSATTGITLMAVAFNGT